MYCAGTSSKMKKNHEIFSWYYMKIVKLLGYPPAHEPASNTVFIRKFFSVFGQ